MQVLKQLAAAACASLILTACSTATTPASSPSTGAGGPSSTTSATPGATATLLHVPGGVDQLMYDDPARPINVAWPVLDGADAMTKAMQAWVDSRGVKFLAENQPSPTSPPELQGTWEFLRREPGKIGVRLDLYEFAGASGYTYSKTFFADTTNGKSWVGTDLVKADQREAVAGAVLASLKASGRSLTEETASPELATAMLDDVTFDTSGNVVVRLAQGLVLPYSDGQVSVTLPDSAAYLTADGAAVATALAGRTGTPSPTAQASSPTESPATSATSTTSTTSTTTTTTEPPKTTTTSTSTSTTTSRPPKSTTTTTTSEPAPEPDPETTTTTKRPATSAPASGVDCSKLKCVALTFDDGPSRYTSSILDSLEAAGAKATFFEIGQSVSMYPSIVRRQVAMGMELGSHTVTHKQLTKLSKSQQSSEIERAADQIADAGGSRPRLMRPPYGSWNSTTKSLGWPIILWDVDSEDWKNKSVSTTTSLIMKNVKRGSIVLMHDIWPSTAQALPGIIRQLKAKGYTLVTVSDLLGRAKGGVVYHKQNG